jgi:hypothetical protein
MEITRSKELSSSSRGGIETALDELTVGEVALGNGHPRGGFFQTDDIVAPLGQGMAEAAIAAAQV